MRRVQRKHSGPKGRFKQPRPKAWDQGSREFTGLKGRFIRGDGTRNGPFRAGMCFVITNPRLCLVLTESALQAERTDPP
jgi:hypothetical protein